MKEVFYVSFFIYRKHGWKKISRQNKRVWKKRNVYLQKVMIFLKHFFLFFRRSWQLFQKWVQFYSEIVIVWVLKQGVSLFGWFSFLIFLVTAFRGFLAPNEAPPPRAPNPMALPAAMKAGTRAAKGRGPPFCLFDVLLLVPLHLFFLLRTMVSSCRLRVYWYNDDGWCVVFIVEGVIYNLNFLLAAIIFRDNFSIANFLPGSASMAWTIFRSAFHLSRMFLALE